MILSENNNHTVLPWYNSLSMQHKNLFYAYGRQAPIIYPRGQVPTFQFSKTSGGSITAFSLINAETGSSTNILSTMVSDSGLEKVSYDDYDLIINPANLQLTTGSPVKEGLHYCTMVVGSETFYSEYFTWKNDVSDMLKLSYWNDEPIVYKNGHLRYDEFRHIFYFNSQLGKPVYEFEEDVANLEGHIFPIQQISIKKYKFEILVPEFVIDALRLVRLHNFKQVVYKGVTYQIEQFIMEPTWQETGDIAAVECEFMTDTVVRKTGSGVYKGGDFNNDYNEDFLNHITE
jgi:hypothetical protein